MDPLIPALANYGVPAILVGCFVWWSWVRENKLSNRLETVEKTLSSTLITVVRENTEANNKMVAALDNMNTTLNRLDKHIDEQDEHLQKVLSALENNK